VSSRHRRATLICDNVDRMAQIAGFRGALWDAAKVQLGNVVASPVTGVKERLGKGELVRDSSRAMYRYHQTFTHGGRSVTRQTLVCAVRLEPWTEGMIRPHEQTDPTARDAATAAIAEAGAHTEAVFAGYRDAAREVDRLCRGVEGGKPTVEVTTPDGTIHRLWRMPSAEVIGKLRQLFAPKKLHVLDGHARYEGMLAYAHKLGADNQPQYSSTKYGLACLVNLDDPSLVLAPRHRLVRTTGIKRDAVLDAAKKYFIVEKVADAAKDIGKINAALGDTVAHQPAFVAAFAGDTDAWKLTLKPDVSPVTEGAQVNRAIQKLDPVVVEHMFLARVLHTTASTTELDGQAVLEAVRNGAAVGMIMRPLPLDQIVHADELGALLPFGSTAFHPPLANLMTFVIDADEDLV
jgi:uncharacterized protein (DUF1015 family)